MEFLEVLGQRKTSNGPFLPNPVSKEHQRLLVEAAAVGPLALQQPALALRAGG